MLYETNLPKTHYKILISHVEHNNYIYLENWTCHLQKCNESLFVCSVWTGYKHLFSSIHYPLEPKILCLVHQSSVQGLFIFRINTRMATWICLWNSVSFVKFIDANFKENQTKARENFCPDILFNIQIYNIWNTEYTIYMITL